MEIKDTLKKPYTDKARADFIVENNHKKGYEIRETNTELQAWGYDNNEQFIKAKERKLEELAQVTAKFEDNLNKDMYFTSSLGFRVNGDRRTRSNIEDLIAFTQKFPVAYRDYDNVMRNVTENELRTILVEHITNGNNLYQTKWLLESQIQECTTIDEVNAIEIKFEMMDFSNTESEETE